MEWYYYLDDKLHFPFTAICNTERAISPLHVKDKVKVIGMAPEGECLREMFVTIRWEKKSLAVPLSQLTPASTSKADTLEAVEDWHYWIVQNGLSTLVAVARLLMISSILEIRPTCILLLS